MYHSWRDAYCRGVDVVVQPSCDYTTTGCTTADTPQKAAPTQAASQNVMPQQSAPRQLHQNRQLKHKSEQFFWTVLRFKRLNCPAQ